MTLNLCDALGEPCGGIGPCGAIKKAHCFAQTTSLTIGNSTDLIVAFDLDFPSYFDLESKAVGPIPSLFPLTHNVLNCSWIMQVRPPVRSSLLALARYRLSSSARSWTKLKRSVLIKFFRGFRSVLCLACKLNAENLFSSYFYGTLMAEFSSEWPSEIKNKNTTHKEMYSTPKVPS